MTTPIQGGGGPVDQSSQAQSTPQPFSTEDSSETKALNPEQHSIAIWFMNTWGWSQTDALAAEKQFIKNVVMDCQRLLNKYKNIYKKLNPDLEQVQ